MAFDFEDTALGETITYDTFGCRVFKADPQTPDRVEPDVVIHREGAEKLELRAPDGREIRVWTFKDPTTNDRPTYPAPTMRVKQGQIVHTRLTTSTGPHTIHHHGIEPTTFNDGVGHVSFEVGDSYTYQWCARDPGTYFYHCHRNTTLHFELGMFGALIVDPPDHEDGKKRIYENGPTYDVEKLWLADDMDPRWHEMEDHDAGLCGMDVGLNRFEPEYFLLSGIFNNETRFHPDTRILARKGERILIRLLNASYSILKVKFGCDVELVACDGRNWGRDPWCDRTRTLPAGQTLELATAQRYDIMVTPPDTGIYPVTMTFHHWITGKVQKHGNGRGIIRPRIKVV